MTTRVIGKVVTTDEKTEFRVHPTVRLPVNNNNSE